MREKLDWEQAKELCVSTMFWEVEMRQALQEQLESNSAVSNGLKSLVGPTTYGVISGIPTTTFSEFYEEAKVWVDNMVSYDGSKVEYEQVLFNVFEDVLFHLGERVSAYERVRKLLTALGFDFEGGVDVLVNDVGADIGGYLLDPQDRDEVIPEKLETLVQMEREYRRFCEDLKSDGMEGASPVAFTTVMWEWEIGDCTSQSFRLTDRELVKEFLRAHNVSEDDIEEFIVWTRVFE